MHCHHGDDACVPPHPQSIRASGQHGKAGLEQKEAALGLGQSGKVVLVARERKAHSSMNLHASGFQLKYNKPPPLGTDKDREDQAVSGALIKGLGG